MRHFRASFVFIALLICASTHAGVLPEDRSDILYHLYDGGGVTIAGPSLLIRKQVAKNVSIAANYYVDMVSSASIDVITTASPYNEERTQKSLSMDYLRGNTTMSLGYTTSVENDFDAKTYALNIKQDMFGDLTTLTLSYAFGDDTVRRVDDPVFSEDNTRQHYGLGLSQILTRNLITTMNLEVITDEGFLNNPYRSVRYADSGSALGYSYEPELYPHTRTTTALGFRARYFLPYRAAIEGQYRYFTDTWGIDAHTAAVSYTHPWGDFTFTGKYRWHKQNGANFFQDLFPRAEATNFRGRDKELSPLTSQTVKFAVSYSFLENGWGFIEKGSLNFSIDHLLVDYDEFRDLTSGAPVGEEPLYSLGANIFQLFFSIWY
jgi:hypothetical protein